MVYFYKAMYTILPLLHTHHSRAADCTHHFQTYSQFPRLPADKFLIARNKAVTISYGHPPQIRKNLKAYHIALTLRSHGSLRY